MAPKIKMAANLEFLLKKNLPQLEFIVLILYFMRLHSLKHEKPKKIIVNSKWRQNPRWMPKFVFDMLLLNS
jgi:hypothetical protein